MDYNTAMSYPSTADFLEDLRQSGQLALIEAEISADQEVAEITRRIARAGGRPLLFGHVEGKETPLVTNLLATEERLCRAFGAKSIRDLAAQVASWVELREPANWLDRLRLPASQGGVGKFPPRLVKTGVCQQVVKLGNDVDLGELPAVRCGCDQSYPAITAAQVFTADVESGQPAVGRYDSLVLDRNRLAVGWLAYDEPARKLLDYRRHNRRMPVAVVLGGDPVGLLAAMAPLPFAADVSSLVGLLRGKARELVRCRTAALDVPTDAEIVIEGHIDPSEPPVETGLVAGPGGYYHRSRPAPVVHVTALTHRANPVFPAMIPGPLPDEPCVVHRFLHRAFLPLLQAAIPDLADLEMPLSGAVRHLALASICKTYAGQARQIASALRALRPWMFAKVLVLVDQDVDVRDDAQVQAAITAHVDPGRDVFFQEGAPDPLDPAGPPDALGRRMAIDATTKLPEERRAPHAPLATTSDAIQRLVADRWEQYGLPSV